jgi:hypothetical protein
MDPDQAMATPASSDPLEILIDTMASKIMDISKGDGDAKTKAKAITELLKKQDKIMAMLKEPAAGGEEAPSEEHTKLSQQIAGLTQQLEQYQAKERRAALKAAIEQELATAGLAKDNPVHVSELFMKQLLTTEAVSDRAALIKDLVALVGESRGSQYQPPRSQPTFESAGHGGGQRKTLVERITS